MANGNRYYWIRITDHFFTSDTVDFLMSQKDGSQYVVLYQMLCLKTIKSEGVLSRQLGDVIIPYDETKIQRDCKWFTIDTVRVALTLYKKIGLIYEDKDGYLVLSDYQKMVGSESDWAEVKRQQRLAQNKGDGQIEDNVQDNVHKRYISITTNDSNTDSLYVNNTEHTTKYSTNQSQEPITDDLKKMALEFYQMYPKKKNGLGPIFIWFANNKPSEDDFESIKQYLVVCIQSPDWKLRESESPDHTLLPAADRFLDMWLGAKNVKKLSMMVNNPDQKKAMELQEDIENNTERYLDDDSLRQRAAVGDEASIAELKRRGLEINQDPKPTRNIPARSGGVDLTKIADKVLKKI
jgi:hypothetical protein